jgi:hypothetical protein
MNLIYSKKFKMNIFYDIFPGVIFMDMGIFPSHSNSIQIAMSSCGYNKWFNGYWVGGPVALGLAPVE